MLAGKPPCIKQGGNAAIHAVPSNSSYSDGIGKLTINHGNLCMLPWLPRYLAMDYLLVPPEVAVPVRPADPASAPSDLCPVVLDLASSTPLLDALLLASVPADDPAD
jgi:hypothetical protein